MNTCVSILRTRCRSAIQQYITHGFRHIYSQVSVGLVEYVNVRARYKNIHEDELQSFRKKMEEIRADTSNTNLVFSEDLKQLVHIVDNDEDIKLLEDLLTKFNKQNSRLRFGSFVFGPVIMRMYHHMNKPEDALRAYKNPELDGFFDELNSHVVLFELLFKNGMYNEILDVYKITREKQCTFGKHPKTLMVPLFGALYKINTEESYNYMMQLLKEMHDMGHVPIRRVICFAAGLALNQNNPHIALELLSMTPNQGFFLVRSIKALANAALGNMDETLIILASVLIIDTPTKHSHSFPADVIENVKQQIKKSNRKDHTIEFNRIEKQLKDFGHITKNTLDDDMCSEFTVFNPVNKMKTVINVALESPQDVKNISKNLRPGLQDMI